MAAVCALGGVRRTVCERAFVRFRSHRTTLLCIFFSSDVYRSSSKILSSCFLSAATKNKQDEAKAPVLAFSHYCEIEAPPPGREWDGNSY